MSYVPDQPQVDTTFKQNGEIFYINATTNLKWPYMSSFNQCSVAVSWVETGNSFGSGNWEGSLIAYVGSTQQSGGQSSTGGANGSQTMTCSTPSSGSFTVRSIQTATVYSNGIGSPPPSSFTMSQPTITFYIDPTDKPITIIGTTNNYANSVQLVRLPLASSVIGKIFYVVNKDNTNFAGVCSYQGEAIDGFTTGSIRLPRWACVGLTPNAAGDAWCILSYYAGNLPYTDVGVYINGTTITSPIVISSNSGTGKTVILPNPTWANGNYLCATTYQTSTTSYGISGQFAIYTNGFFAQDTTANKYFSLVPASDSDSRYDHNMSIAFISDGSKWYIASVFDGQNCQINFVTQDRTHITSPIFITSFDGGNPDMRVAAGGNTATPMYFKMNHTSSSNGFVMDSSGTNSGGYVCSQNNIRCYKISGTLDYNAFAMIQAGVSGTVINFPVGMYPSAY